MPYDGKILSRAMARFDEDKQRRARQFRERQQQLFARAPVLADRARRLRGTMSPNITRARKGAQAPGRHPRHPGRESGPPAPP